MKKIKIKKSLILYLCAAILVVLLNILAWYSNAFCDFYIAHIFPVWVNTYGRFSGMFAFSIGEWLLVLGVLVVFLAAALLPASLIAGVAALKHCKTNVAGVRASHKFLSFCKNYYIFFAWTLLTVSLIMTLNCFILYHASTFSEKYFGGEEAEYELEDVIHLRNRIAQKCNELSARMERDEKGRILYPGEAYPEGSDSAQNPQTAHDMQDKAREAMANLGKGISYGEQAAKLRAYPQLDGYYPRPKALFFSDFMCQQYMQGYYFPFSMEANYNDVMYVMNKPFTMCHELAHLRGYIYEDEANFIGYLACTQSDDIYFQYSGYLCALSYLESDLWKARRNAPNAFEAATKAEGLEPVEDQVYADNLFVEQEEWDRINAKALISTETVDKAADVFIDTNLKINGIEDGALSYSRMVKLLMLYYL